MISSSDKIHDEMPFDVEVEERNRAREAERNKRTETIAQIFERDILNVPRCITGVNETLHEYSRFRDILTNGETTLTKQEKTHLIAFLDEQEHTYNPPLESIETEMQKYSTSDDLSYLLAELEKLNQSPMRRDYRERMQKTLAQRIVAVGFEKLREHVMQNTLDELVKTFRTMPELFSWDVVGWLDPVRWADFNIEYKLATRSPLDEQDLPKLQAYLRECIESMGSSWKDISREYMKMLMFEGMLAALKKIDDRKELETWRQEYWTDRFGIASNAYSLMNEERIKILKKELFITSLRIYEDSKRETKTLDTYKTGNWEKDNKHSRKGRNVGSLIPRQHNPFEKARKEREERDEPRRRAEQAAKEYIKVLSGNWPGKVETTTRYYIDPSQLSPSQEPNSNKGET